MNNTATNSTPCPTVRKQIGKTTYIVRVHFSETAKETIHQSTKGGAIMQLLTHIIFVLNLLKTLINHFT